MNFYFNFEFLCKAKGTTPTAVVKKLNLSTSKITAWKNGSIPKMEILKLLANFLDTPVDRFFAENINEASPVQGEVSRQAVTEGLFTADELQLIEAYRKLDLKGKSKVLTFIFEALEAVEVIKSTEETAGTSI